MDISAFDLIRGQASIGPNGSPVFDRAGKTGPPFLRSLSQTLGEIDQIRLLMCRSFVRPGAVPLFGFAVFQPLSLFIEAETVHPEVTSKTSLRQAVIACQWPRA